MSAMSLPDSAATCGVDLLQHAEPSERQTLAQSQDRVDVGEQDALERVPRDDAWLPSLRSQANTFDSCFSCVPWCITRNTLNCSARLRDIVGTSAVTIRVSAASSFTATCPSHPRGAETVLPPMTTSSSPSTAGGDVEQ